MLKKITYLFVTVLMLFTLVACTTTPNTYQEVYNDLDVQFEKGDSRSSVTKNFKLPIKSDVDENAIIEWTSSNSKVVAIEDNINAIVVQQSKVQVVNLNVKITIDGKDRTFVYSVTVLPIELNRYTITFDSNGGTNVSNVNVTEGELLIKPIDPTQSGYTFEYWLLNDEKYDFNTPVTNSFNLVASWIKDEIQIIKYQVTFDSNNGSDIVIKEVDEGLIVDKIDDPVKEGYTFVGWFLNDNLYNFETPITNDITLLASFEIKTSSYKVIYLLENITDESYVESSETFNVDAFSEVLVTPEVLTGFTLVEGNAQTHIVLPDNSLVITFRYDRIVYDVSFDGNIQKVKYEGNAVVPNIDVPLGYTFDWDKEIPQTITESISFESILTPMNVKYVIRHMGQNLAGNAYIQLLREEKEGLTDTVINVEDKEFENYILEENQKFEYKILGDGSLIIEIKYDRASHEVIFDLSLDNQGLVTIYVRHEGSVNLPIVNEKEGFDVSWEPLIPNLITEDSYFTLEYKPANVKYIVNYYGQNILDDEYSLLETTNLSGLTGSLATFDALEFEGFTLIDNQEHDLEIRADGSLVVSVYYVRNVYDVTFRYSVDGIEKEETHSVRHGNKVNEIEVNIEGFNYWTTLENVVYDFDNIVKGSFVLIPFITQGDIEYIVNHYHQNVSDNNYTLAQTDKFNGSNNQEVSAQARSYYGFNVKSLDSGVIRVGEQLVLNIYYDRNIYNVTFLYEDIDDQEVRYQDFIEVPKEEDLEKEGYEFVKFEIQNQENKTINDPVEDNLYVIVIRKDIEKPLISAQTTEFEFVRSSQTNIDFIKLANLTVSDNEGTQGISLDVNLQDFDINVSGSYEVIITATDEANNFASVILNIEVIPITYVVILEISEYSNENIIALVEEQTKLNLEPITKENHKFIEWQLDGVTFDITQNITQNLTLKAIWEEAITYKVAFNSNGGTPVSQQFIENTKTAVMPIEPKRLNYLFNGWYLGSKLFDFNTPITNNVDLTAMWIKTSEINKLDVDDKDVLFYQTNKNKEIYVTIDNELFVSDNNIITNLTEQLELLNGEKITYMISTIGANDQVGQIVVVTSLGNVKYVNYNFELDEFNSGDIITLENVSVLYRFDLFEGNKFIIFDQNDIYLWRYGNDIINITNEFNLDNDEFIVFNDVVVDDPFDFIIKTNKRYFLPTSEASIYSIEYLEETNYVDITTYLLDKLMGSKVVDVKASLEGISAFDEHLNKLIITQTEEKLLLSNFMLNENEEIIDAQLPFFITSDGRLLFTKEVNDTNLVTIINPIDENQEFTLLVVNRQMTILQTNDNKYYLVENILPSLNDITDTINTLLENEQIDLAYKSSEAFIVIGNNKVLIIA